MRGDCPYVIPDDRCAKADYCAEPRPRSCPSETEPLGRCDAGCDWVGTADAWRTHNCERPKGAGHYTIPTPRVAQHVIELLDLIELQPHDPRHVIRHSDHSEVPITTVGVLRLLHRPLDQRTAAAVTAELARISKFCVDVAQRLVDTENAVASMAGQVPDVDGIDWAAFDLKERSDQQVSMRRHIAAVEVTA